jgi:putative secretion ATPase (PEP-CTERM system associated)
MYERFYHLRDRPFALSPDPDYLYPSRVHREALDYLRFGIEGNAGFVVVTGEIGSGKTTLLQVLLRNLDGQTTVIRLVNTLLTGRELIESMLLDLGFQNPPATKPLMLRELARLLVEQRSAGRRVVAVIDEAQNLSLDALEELRMLSNLETEKSKLLQIVLVGQPDLRDSLERPQLEQLRQRITVRYHIEPLDVEETAHYINHRLKRAAIAAPLVFPATATHQIHARSGGVPRLINVICDAVLLCGYAEESRQIDDSLVQTAISELEASTVLRRSPQATRSAVEPARAERSDARPATSTPMPAAAPDLPLRAEPARTREDASELLSDRVMAERRRPDTEPEVVAPPRSVIPAATPVRREEAAPAAAGAGARTVAHVRPTPRPVSYAAPRPAASAWTRMKEVLFGIGAEVERR